MLRHFTPSNDLVPPQSSPTISSPSSSDLDSQSTGSFFHDRSTTLGTLMGVTLHNITFRASSRGHRPPPPDNPTASSGRNGQKRRRWWRLCGDETDAKRASLGQYLEVERRSSGEGILMVQRNNGSRALFADGRVLPPSQPEEESTPPHGLAGVCGFTTVERWCSRV